MSSAERGDATVKRKGQKLLTSFLSLLKLMKVLIQQYFQQNLSLIFPDLVLPNHFRSAWACMYISAVPAVLKAQRRHCYRDGVPIAGHKMCVVQYGMSSFAVKEDEKSVLHKQATICIMTSLFDVMSHL